MKKGLTELILMHDNIMPVSDAETKAPKTQKDLAEFFKTLKKAENGERQIRFTGVFFGGDKKVMAEDIPLKSVKLNAADFSVTGTRSIFDCAAETVIEKGKAYSKKDESAHPENVIFVITAFGRDNASKSFTYSQVADMIRHQSEVYKWKFFCLTSDAFVAEQLGLYGDSAILLNDEDEDYFSAALNTLYERVMNVIDPPIIETAEESPEPEPEN